MNQNANDLRTQTLRLATGGTKPATTPDQVQITALIQAWLASLEEEDLAGLSPDSLASGLWEGFSTVAKGSQGSCHVQAYRYADGRGGSATALLIVNQDMPFLVDSIVIAMRKLRIASRAVLNAVLSVRRGTDKLITHVDRAQDGADPLESVVLCLLSDELSETDLAAITARIRMVAGDAAAVRRDAVALAEKLSVAAAGLGSVNADTQEVAAFLQWAGNGGFEPFGYAYYQILPGQRELRRDVASRIGVLQDPMHPVYDTCLAGIPEDSETVTSRTSALSVVLS